MRSMPASVQSLLFLYETAKRTFGDDFVWSVCGTNRFQLLLCTTALICSHYGGSVRVGVEDSLYAGKGFSVDIATPDEARQILGFEGLDEVSY